MDDSSAAWPLFSLVLRTPRLELHAVRDADLPALAAAAVAGIHEPGRSPFPAAWAEVPAEQLPADLARYQWSLRAATRPDSWRVAFAIVEDGAVIGCQDLLADEFAARRTVSSGSWLTRAAQGRGLGREMRAAALLLAFDHLGAEVAESSALAWNTASIRVSTGLGYEPNGTQRTVGADGVAVEEVRFRVTPDTFRRPEWELEVSGLEAARAFLIAGPAADS
ncbi:RimJ/RimL family protein N-acetyltransferase [Rathayibacter sp. PhB93]|jgi:RimJ/RimL family protein N-acetyltransferase|uniref:GNAT family N-acetyltransferase n=1 Tax=unclassified Rathayibacter TaxID=2609250 RepID=UPI000F49D957|nr:MULTISPECIES: GNAT family protein [unclassified Rathayibacter]ROQ05415.1 RimJ/RimL family protein N-acetyltransferase [Rathayibacter sp. PhB93]TDQ12514.1 RimJ/RimL family protein N-acetyltransferase [Rathayibacter sp. PhB1]